MRYLRTNTATIVTVGPFFDKTDGVTLETALTISNERISFTVDANDGSAPTLVLDNVTGATSGTANDLNYITNNDAALMQLELSAANTNYLGRAFLTITDAANHVPVFHEFTILPAMVYDSLVAGTDVLQADLTQINGAAVSTSTAQLGVNAVQAGGTAWGSGAITAASIASDAITAAKIADNAIDAGAIATGAITSAKFAAGAIDAAAIAADAIGSSELAATAVAEIADAVWDELQADHTGATTMGGSLAEAGADNSDVVAQAVWDLDTTGHEIAGTFGEAMSNAGGGSSPADIADAVWDEATAGHVAAGSAGLALAYARDGSLVNASATAADNQKKFFDGTGYAAGNSTIGTATTVTNTVNANVTNLNSDATLFAALLAVFETAVPGTVVSGTNTTTVISTGLASTVNDFYKGKMLVVTSGTKAKQGGKLVTGYDGATKRLTVEALTAALTAGDTFVLLG